MIKLPDLLNFVSPALVTVYLRLTFFVSALWSLGASRPLTMASRR